LRATFTHQRQHNNAKPGKKVSKLCGVRGSAEPIIEAKDLKQAQTPRHSKCPKQFWMKYSSSLEAISCSRRRQTKKGSASCGQVMKGVTSKANPGLVNPILAKMLKG